GNSATGHSETPDEGADVSLGLPAPAVAFREGRKENGQTYPWTEGGARRALLARDAPAARGVDARRLRLHAGVARGRLDAAARAHGEPARAAAHAAAARSGP